MFSLDNNQNDTGRRGDGVNTYNGTVNNTANQPQRGQTSGGRQLTNEDRRRIAAARNAGMRMNQDELRRNVNQAGRTGQSGQPVRGGQQRQNPAGYGGYGYGNNGQGQRMQQNPYAARQNQGSRGRVPPEGMQRKRRHRRISVNMGVVIFALLIVGVIGVSAFQISRNATPSFEPEIKRLAEPDALTDVDNTAGDSTDIDPDAAEATENADSDGSTGVFGTVTIDNSAIDEGKLVLVNYNYAYNKIDKAGENLKNAYTERTGKLKVSSTTLGMEPTAFAALESLVAGLYEDTGCDDLLIYSGYRTLDDQQRIWDSNMANSGEEYTKTYVAKPGHSEHHTGLACDLGFYTDDGKSIPLVDHEFGSWVSSHCTEYGYILRYPAEKADITGIGHEQWHFRYVGLPHAYATNALDMCLEEYIDHLHAYTFDAKLLHVSTDRMLSDVTASEVNSVNDGWLVYFVPMTEGGTTDIPLLDGERFADYDISGSNTDGFIVTVSVK